MSIEKSNGQQAQARLLQNRASILAEELNRAIDMNTKDRKFGI